TRSPGVTERRSRRGSHRNSSSISTLRSSASRRQTRSSRTSLASRTSSFLSPSTSGKRFKRSPLSRRLSEVNRFGSLLIRGGSSPREGSGGGSRRGSGSAVKDQALGRAPLGKPSAGGVSQIPSKLPRRV